MGLIQEFREFAAKGNVVDLAVGVIIGGAFGKIVTSVVEDVVMPPLGLVLGRVDFTNLYIPLDGKVRDAANAAGGALSLAEARKLGPVLAYGSLLNTLVQFLILAFVIFLMVKAINRLRREDPPSAFRRAARAARAARGRSPAYGDPGPALPPGGVEVVRNVVLLLLALLFTAVSFPAAAAPAVW